MLEGSCACGRVTYEVHGALLGPVDHCHCRRCRKQSAASFATTAGMCRSDFVLRSGEALLHAWESSPGVRRFFASCCGAPIHEARATTPDVLRLRLGTLDTDPGIRIERHFTTGSRAPWVTFEDPLPRSDGGPPFGTRD